MTELLITLPEELVERLLVRAAEAGYPDVSAYIASVVRAELGEPADTPRAFEPHTREQIRAKLREALAEPGPFEPMMAEDWESIRRECRERLAAARHPASGDGP